MKRTYLIPQNTVYIMHIKHHFMEGSLDADENEETEEVLAREEQTWVHGQSDLWNEEW